jgi:hypothetical protein
MTYLDNTAAAIKAHVPEDLLPDEPRVDELFRLYALLARVKGTSVTAEDVHDAWSLWMIGEDGDHKSIKPYDELDPETRREDQPFVDAIRAVAAEQRRGSVTLGFRNVLGEGRFGSPQFRREKETLGDGHFRWWSICGRCGCREQAEGSGPHATEVSNKLLTDWEQGHVGCSDPTALGDRRET